MSCWWYCYVLFVLLGLELGGVCVRGGCIFSAGAPVFRRFGYGGGVRLVGDFGGWWRELKSFAQLINVSLGLRVMEIWKI